MLHGDAPASAVAATRWQMLVENFIGDAAQVQKMNGLVDFGA
jgi:hypothetical protein